jgi:hypothetical protein
MEDFIIAALDDGDVSATVSKARLFTRPSSQKIIIRRFDNDDRVK